MELKEMSIEQLEDAQVMALYQKGLDKIKQQKK